MLNKENFKNKTYTQILKIVAQNLKRTRVQVLKNKNSNCTQEDFLKQEKIHTNVDNYLKKLGNVDSASEQEFFLYLSKMCALFCDAHTVCIYNKIINMPKKFITPSLIYINKKVYVAKKLAGKLNFCEVKSIDGVAIKKLLKEIKSVLCYETNELLEELLNRNLTHIKALKTLGMKLKEIELVSGEKLKIKLQAKQDNKIKFLPPYDSNKAFDVKLLQNNTIIKIDYKKCFEKEKGEISNFFKEVSDILKTKTITSYVLDLRGNVGGDSQLIKPLLDMLKKQNLPGVALMDRAVFSSGTWAIFHAKKFLNATTIGQNAGQGTKRFGNNGGFIKINDDISVNYSTKFFNFTEEFNYNGVIKPDIYVPLKLEDIALGKDASLERAIKYLLNASKKQNSSKKLSKRK